MQIDNAQLTAAIRSLQARFSSADPATLQKAIATWEMLASKFGTLIGNNGVQMIMGRCRERLRPQYPWLPAGDDPQFTQLHASFCQQTDEEAVAANNALLEGFIALLATLIGSGLTVQFLRSALADDGAAPNSLET
jgi:hypothetical protein